MKSKKGRPSGKLLDKYSFDLDKISNYFKENIKEEQPKQQEQPQTEQPKQQEQPQTEQPKQQEQPQTEQPKQQEQPQLKRVIVFDKNMLIKADIVVSAILESGLNFIGIKKELFPMNEKEAELLVEIMPPIELEKNWTNFFIAYIMLKITQ
jgi:outer membrane biosynthesis protein TonB